MKRMMSIGVGALFAIAVAPSHALQLSRYEVSSASITDLGTLGGAQSMALDINDAGYMVGWAETASGERHAFYNLMGSYVYDIGAYNNVGRSVATGINNSKYIVGNKIDEYGNTRAFRWYAGAIVMLDDTDPSSYYVPISSDAVAIADNGYIVGHRTFMYYPWGQPPIGPVSNATLWTNYWTYHDLYRPIAYESSFVHDLNDAAQTAGRAESAASQFAYRWDWSGAGVTSYQIPGVIGTSHGDALGVNAAGVTVGWDIALVGPSYTVSKRAILWDGYSGTSRDLGWLPNGTMSVAEDVNDGNFVVGYGNRTVPKGRWPITFDSGFLYHGDFGMYELPKLPSAPWGNCRALALNERASYDGNVQIVGYCEVSAGVVHAVRWDVKVTVWQPVRPFP